MFRQASILAGLLLGLAMAVPASAQGTNIAFGAFTQDVSLPVEISADELQVDQADGSASFVGNVVIGQGEMRLTAGKVRVEYKSGDDDATGRISRLIASGGVTLVSGSEAAEAKTATYSIDTGEIAMSGGVILTQGQNALSAEQLVVNLTQGTGVLSGGVKTILQTGGD